MKCVFQNAVARCNLKSYSRDVMKGMGSNNLKRIRGGLWKPKKSA